MKVIILYDDYDKLPKIKYVFDFIFTLPICEKGVQLEYKHIENYKPNNTDYKLINYSKKNIENALNCKISYWFIDKPEFISKLYSIKYSFNDDFLFGIGLEQKNMPFIKDNIINLDIVQTFFFHLSRMEEYYAREEQLDFHRRMKSNEQFLVKNNIYRFPVLDKISFAFLSVLGLENTIETRKIMSHDIDVIQKFPNFYRFVRGVSRILFKKKKHKGSLLKYIKWYLKVKFGDKDPYNTFTWLFSKKNMHKKYVFFMSGGTTNYDNLYKINNPKIKNYIGFAKENDYEIGLHPSYSAYTNKNQFKKEKNILEKVCQCKIQSTRQHILHFDLKKTPQLLEDCNIKIESTLGYQDLIGFRCGTGFKYKLWNFKNNQPYNLTELPLIIMDGCLLIEADYDVNKARNIYFDFYAKNKYNTQITFNFHNSIFDPVLLDDMELKKLFFEL